MVISFIFKGQENLYGSFLLRKVPEASTYPRPLRCLCGETEMSKLVEQRDDVHRKLAELGATKGVGNLWVVERPSGSMSPADLDRMLNSMKANGMIPDMVVVDYADLMRASYDLRDDLNLNTVLKVIQMLEEEGYLYSVKGKGCFVKKGYNLDIGKRMTPILNTFRFGQNSKDTEIDFSNGGPPKEYFPIQEYKEIINEILSDEIKSKYLMAYQNIQGLESLRETLVDFIRKYGIRREKDDIIICSGTQIALELISTAFGISPKKTVLLSDPTYQNAVNILKSYCNIENIDMKD